VTNGRRLISEPKVIQKYAVLSQWQIEEVRKGIAEADCGDFARDEDVKRTINKWTRPLR
jgi:predicted transcriptional regulator